ncbi:hypothetical protein COEREDRAFT_15579 [Coemansia reversa NRRL 1564]|uniref:Sfi1 spindle body domain-containing protein n=1 Tax=Coemansia reversa (strain ATCC 12441 / NRRL 1564) TaxID=763665 RepID=A0A2G5BB65_COERN|nr:hypothetical protein COEREDRAFT_15579 [Coemansia reversa NRRL 1564]|eukprot:PIA16232.1 hypothetical protein COEREDRAFT_15579 [Coemansia reversa NRRL 1564]
MEDTIATPYRGRRILNRGNSVAKYNSKHESRFSVAKHTGKHGVSNNIAQRNGKDDITQTITNTTEVTGLISPHEEKDIAGGALRGFIDSRYKGKADIALLMMVRRWREIAVASSNRREELVSMWREAFVFRRETLVRKALNTWRHQLHQKMQTEDYRYRHTQMKLAEMHDRQRVLRKGFDNLIRHRDLQRRLDFWQKEQDEALVQRSFNILREAAAEKRLDSQLHVLGEQLAERRQRRMIWQCLGAWREMAAEHVAQARHAQEQAESEAEAQATKGLLRELFLGWRAIANHVEHMEDVADEQYVKTLASTTLTKLKTVAAKYARDQGVADRYSNFMIMDRAYTTLRDQFETRRQQSEETRRQEKEQTESLEAADNFYRTKCLQKSLAVWRQVTRTRQNEQQQSRVLRDWARRRIQRKRHMLLMAWYKTAAKERANVLRAEEFQGYRDRALLQRCFDRLLKRCSFVPRKPGVVDVQTMTSEPHLCDRGTSAVTEPAGFTHEVPNSVGTVGLKVQQSVHPRNAAEAAAGPGIDRGAGFSAKDVPKHSTESGATLDSQSVTFLHTMLTQWRTVAQQHAQQERQADAFTVDRHRTGNQKLCIVALRRWRMRLKQMQQLELAADTVYRRNVVQRSLLRITKYARAMELKRDEADQLRHRYLLTTAWVNLLTVANERAAERVQHAASAGAVDALDDAGNPENLNALETAPIATQDDGPLLGEDLAPDAAINSFADSVDHGLVELYFSAWRDVASELRAAEDEFADKVNRPLLQDCFRKLCNAIPAPTPSNPVGLTLNDDEREAELDGSEQQLRRIVERNTKRHALHRLMVVTRGKLMENQRLAQTMSAFVRAAAERGRLARTAQKMEREHLLRKVLTVWRTRVYVHKVQQQNADVHANGTLAYKCILHWLALTRARRAHLQTDPLQNKRLQLEAPQSEQHPHSLDIQPVRRSNGSQYERALAFRWEKQMRRAFDALLMASSNERIRVHVAQNSVSREEDLIAVADRWNKRRILRNALHHLRTSARLSVQQEQLMTCFADAWANTNLKRRVFVVLRSRISPDSSMFDSAIDNDPDTITCAS